MIVVKSNCTGQVLFTVQLDSADLGVSPSEARAILEALSSTTVGKHILIGQSGSSPVTADCMFGGAAASHDSVSLEPAARAVNRIVENCCPHFKKGNTNAN